MATKVAAESPRPPADGDSCVVTAGTHAGKSGIARDLNTSKTGHLTITVVQADGERFKTLAKNVTVQAAEPAPSELIDQRIAELAGWRGDTLARMRKLIHEADPAVVETWKWMGTPVWEHDGILCTGESYKDKIKLTFAKGAALADPAKLFNSSLDGNARRAIDIVEGEQIDATAFKALIHAAIALNGAKKAKPKAKPKAKTSP